MRPADTGKSGYGSDTLRPTIASILLVTALASACSTKKGRAGKDAAAAEPPAPPVVVTPPPAPAYPPTPGMIELARVGFAAPESVLYLPDQDVYLVSNMNGAPGAADDNGFISKVAPDGVVSELAWIDGAKAEVVLNAPKGMAVLRGKLYVADLTTVRIFDVATGAPAGAVSIEGANFLADVAAGVDTIYVSNIGDGAGTPGTDAVFAIDAAGSVTTIASGAELAGPNGLAVIGGHVWVVPFASKELYRLHDGRKLDGTALPAGRLDGIEALPDGRVVVTSWEGRAIYIGQPGSAFVALAEGLDTPADLGFDRKRNRIMVPLPSSDAVRFYPLR